MTCPSPREPGLSADGSWDATKVVGDLAESWTVSPDGLTFTFKLKPGLVFASGNPITADDMAWSFERVVKLDKGPAFLIEPLGLTGDNVAEKAKAIDPTTFSLTLDKPYAPSFVDPARRRCSICSNRSGENAA